MYDKITQQQAIDLLEAAKEQVNTTPHYRLGQAIWGLLPGAVVYGVSCPELFYSEDDNLSIDLLYKYFVYEY